MIEQIAFSLGAIIVVLSIWLWVLIRDIKEYKKEIRDARRLDHIARRKVPFEICSNCGENWTDKGYDFIGSHHFRGTLCDECFDNESAWHYVCPLPPPCSPPKPEGPPPPVPEDDA